MTAPSDVSSRILAAATLAEQAAAKATQGDRVIRIEGGVDGTGEGWSQISVDFGQQDQYGSGPGCMLGDTEDGELAEDDARLIAASGPSHWGAVAELLRVLAEIHKPYGSATFYCDWCSSTDSDETFPCESLAALLPLVDQIIRDLGDGQ